MARRSRNSIAPTRRLLAIGPGGKSLIRGPVAASLVWGLLVATTLFTMPTRFRLAMQIGPGLRARLRRPTGD